MSLHNFPNVTSVYRGLLFDPLHSAQVVSGLLSYGVLQIGLDNSFKPWRVFFLLTGGMTLVVALAYWIWFPDSPMTAKFLTEDEKIM